jgi:hypothetical protein
MEREVVPTETKAGWIARLASSGLDIVQAGSFVHLGKVL